MAKKRVPAIDGWFAMDTAEPRLLGTKCSSCGTYFFPKESSFCRNPGCSSTDLEEVPLSPRGVLWSFTNNCYPPPKPYVTPDPFVPYIVAAVELEREKMIVLGQVAGDVKIGDLAAGMEMELCLDTLFEDDAAEHIIWKWRPAKGAQ